jgi:hypothetical protein
MRCPNCNAENPSEAKTCAGCGTRLARRPRRRANFDESNTPFASGPDSRNPAALRAYRCSVLGMIPILGLVLGPVALVLGLLAWHQDRANPDAIRGPAIAAIILGFLALLTNWTGIVLMWIGLTSGS